MYQFMEILQYDLKLLWKIRVYFTKEVKKNCFENNKEKETRERERMKKYIVANLIESPYQTGPMVLMKSILNYFNHILSLTFAVQTNVNQI